MKVLEKIYSVPEAARRLQYSEYSVYKLLNSRTLDGNRVGNRWRSTESSILAFLKGGGGSSGAVESGTEERQAA